MKATYKETRHLHAFDLRALCIEKNWYTAGSNEEYAHLFELTKRKTSLDTEAIIEIAKDIYEHTATHDLHDYRVEDIAFEVNRFCTVTFDEVPQITTCDRYVGAACIHTGCPVIFAGAPKAENCKDCPANEGCKNCVLDGTEYCIKEDTQ